ncbi:MAG: imelysin family protein [Acidimicrobiales bacterium]
MQARGKVLAVVVAFAAAGCAGSRPSASPAPDVPAGAQQVDVTLAATGCSPDHVTVQPGLVAFTASNSSGGTASFALVSGDTAVGELERIADGDQAILTLDLAAGTYRSVCRLGPTVGGGSIQVGDAVGDAGVGPAPDLTAATGAYRAALAAVADQAATDAGQLRQACDAGDLAGARQAEAGLRRSYGQLEPAARDFVAVPVSGRQDLGASIDPAGPTTPTGGGLPRIDAGLWIDGTTAGLSDVAAQVQLQLMALQARIGTVSISPTSVAPDLAGFLGSVPSKRVAEADGPTGRSQVLAAAGAVDGAGTFVLAYGDALARRDPQLAATLTDRLQRAQGAASAAVGSDPGSPVPATARRTLTDALDALADTVASAGAALSLPVPS